MRRPADVAGALAAVALVVAAAACGGASSPTLPVVQPAVVTPPSGAVVDAREWGTRDVGLARKPGSAVVSVVDDQGHGVDGLKVSVDGKLAVPCSNGCYRAKAGAGPVVVQIDGRSWRFTIPATAPSGTAELAAAKRAYARLRTLVLRQQLASGPGAALDTTFVFVAPDRLRYSIVGGSDAVVIGEHRWDRPSPSEAWVESPQTRTSVMTPPWSRPIDVHVVGPGELTFFDLTTRAWYRLTLDSASKLPLTERMTGVSHFMLNRYSGFDAPAAVRPPR